MLMNFVKFLAEGGHAQVYTNDNMTEIRKVIPKYTYSGSHKFINYNAILDLSIQRSFGGRIPGIPVISSYNVDDENVIFTMPYYGVTVSRDSVPADMIPYVIKQLLVTLLWLEANGIQHTDIKPCNVLVDPSTYKTTLIDYNMVSQLVQTPNGKAKWTPSYGTWNYCAPEIVLYGKPTDTSSVWSVGLLIAYLYARYPIRDVYKVSCQKLATRTFWRNLLKTACEKSKDGFPLSNKHLILMPQTMIDIYRSCMRWEPSDRITLADMYKVIEGEYLTEPISFSLSNNVATKLDKKILNICRATKTLHVYPRSLDIIQRLDLPDTLLLFEIGCAVHYLTLMMTGSYVTDDEEFTKNTLSYWQVTLDGVEAAMWEILKILDWNIWIPADRPGREFKELVRNHVTACTIDVKFDKEAIT
jgi:serine/threonine protein kinase